MESSFETPLILASDFKQMLQTFDIQTRLGSTHTQITYEFVNETNIKAFQDEFSALANLSETPMMKWIHSRGAKGKLDSGEEVLFEILGEMYKKIENLERLIKKEERTLPPLANIAKLGFVGHNVLCLKDGHKFDNMGDIYVRMFLPIFPERDIGIFAKVIHSQIAHIQKLHLRDTRGFDSFVVECERAMILDAKSNEIKE